MKIIRKIWIGKSIKEDSMSWELDQSVKLGRGYDAPRGKVSAIIKEDDGTYTIYIKQGNQEMAWKRSSMDATVEYDVFV